MKRCPQCDRTYPDYESFCETDGTALSGAGAESAGTGARIDANAGPRECPACGGKAEAGEVICNFCGARLADGPTSMQPEPVMRPGADESGTFAPPPGTSRMENAAGGRDGSSGRRIFGAAGYAIAAAAALGAGIWLALYLSTGTTTETAPGESPTAAESPAPIARGPSVALSSATQITVQGDAAGAPERSALAARLAFDTNRGMLLDAYERALAGESTLDDAMALRLHVNADGTVSAGSVRVSTSPNPGLDAAVVANAMSWRFAPITSGDAEVDYPLVFVRNSTDSARIESELATKLAALGPAEAPEYASVAAPPAAAASPVVETLPEVAAAETPGPAATPVRRKLSRRELAAIPKPTPTLLERVQERLHSDRKFNRVKAYTAGTVVTLYGKVFDDKDKSAAVRMARSADGVTDVVDTLQTDTAEWSEMQNRIQAQLQSAGLDKVTVKVIGRDAYLDGEVKTALERERAVTIAQSAAPVTVRGNLIRVAVGNMFGF